MKQSLVRYKSCLAAGSYYFNRPFRSNVVPLENLADRSYEICPRFRVEAITPFYWPSHESRIKGAKRHSAQVVIREHLNRTSIDMTPVKLHHFRDAVLIDGSVFLSGRRRIELRGREQHKWPSVNPRGEFVDLDCASIASTSTGTSWFGHWLEDEVPRQLLTQPLANALLHNRPLYSHEARYRELLNLPLSWRVAGGRIRELIFADEHAQNPHKTQRYHEIRRRLAIAKTPVSVGHKVFLLRGESGTPRKLINEEELASHFQGQGYRCIRIAEASLDELLDTCMGASVVVSVEGSQLAHCLYTMQEGGTMIILAPPQQVHTTVADIGVFCGLHAGVFVCKEDDAQTDGFVADTAELTHFIDEAMNHAEKNKDRLNEYVQKVIDLSPLPNSA